MAVLSFSGRSLVLLPATSNTCGTSSNLPPLTLLCISFHTSSAPSETDDGIFEILDTIFNVCFLLEALILIVALGFWNKPPAGRKLGLCGVKKLRKMTSEGTEIIEDQDELELSSSGYHKGFRWRGGYARDCSRLGAERASGSIVSLTAYSHHSHHHRRRISTVPSSPLSTTARRREQAISKVHGIDLIFLFCCLAGVCGAWGCYMALRTKM